MPNYDFACQECLHEWEMVVPYAERDIERTCPSCGDGPVVRLFPAPAVMNASYPDHIRRKGFQDLKEISKLRKEQLHSRKETKRVDLAKEMKKINQSIKG